MHYHCLHDVPKPVAVIPDASASCFNFSSGGVQLFNALLTMKPHADLVLSKPRDNMMFQQMRLWNDTVMFPYLLNIAFNEILSKVYFFVCYCLRVRYCLVNEVKS